MPDEPELGTANGHEPLGGDQDLVAQIEIKRAQLVARRDELQAQLDAIAPDLKRYERAIRALINEPAPTGGAAHKKPTKSHGTGISDDRLAQIKRVIFQVAREQEEFRQVDIRAITQFNSSMMATSFEKLRQQNVIRMARADGNNKWFRLTREGLRELEAAPGKSASVRAQGELEDARS